MATQLGRPGTSAVDACARARSGGPFSERELYGRPPGSVPKEQPLSPKANGGGKAAPRGPALRLVLPARLEKATLMAHEGEELELDCPAVFRCMS